MRHASSKLAVEALKEKRAARSTLRAAAKQLVPVDGDEAGHDAGNGAAGMTVEDSDEGPEVSGGSSALGFPAAAAPAAASEMVDLTADL